MSARRSKAGARRATAGGRFLLRLEDIDHDPLPAANMPPRSSKTSPGSGSTGTGRCAGNPSISTITARRWRGSTRRGCSTRASAPGARSRPRSRAPAVRRKTRRWRRGRSIPAPAGGSTRPNAPSGGRGGGGLRAASRCRRRAGPHRPAGLVRGRAAAIAADPGGARRCRAGAQGGADQLSPRGHGRRRAAGRDAGDARRRPVRRDPHPPAAAGAARPADAALPPPPAVDRRARPPPRQTRQGADDPRDARQAGDDARREIIAAAGTR